MALLKSKISGTTYSWKSDDIRDGEISALNSAIEAIVNVNGCCNVCPPTNYNNLENYGVYYTTNADKSITAQGTTGADASGVPIIGDYIPNKYVGYKLSGCVGGSNETYFINVAYSNDGSTWETENHQYDEPITVANYPYINVWLAVRAGVTVNTTFYPMLYDVRLKPTGYVPYAMTNRELTEKVKGIYKNYSLLTMNGGTESINISAFATGRPYLIMCSGQYNPLWRYMGLLCITEESVGYLYDIVTDATLTVSVSGNTLTLRNNNYENNQVVGVTIIG